MSQAHLTFQKNADIFSGKLVGWLINSLCLFDNKNIKVQ